MALDNVTFFEVNLPGEIFANRSTGERGEEPTEHDTKTEETEAAESGGRSKGKFLVVAAALAGVAFGVRKLRSGGSEDDEIEMEYERPGVEVEAEADQ